MNVIHHTLHIGVYDLTPQHGAEHQVLLRSPVVGNVNHVRAKVNAVTGKPDSPVCLSGIQPAQFIRIHGHPQELVFDAENIVEGLEKARRLHIAEAVADLVESDTPDNIGDRGSITDTGRIFVHIMAYVLLLVVALADVLSIRLLLRVRKGDVFTGKSVSLIRGISWCCILLCLAFLLLGIYFQLALIMAFLALFLGICLRVVKNVIEEATLIKSENDLTV